MMEPNLTFRFFSTFRFGRQWIPPLGLFRRGWYVVVFSFIFKHLKRKCQFRLTTDPAHWYNFYELCSGNKQSPIDIVPQAAMPQNFLPIHLGNYDTSGKPLTLINNGHTGIQSH